MQVIDHMPKHNDEMGWMDWIAEALIRRRSYLCRRDHLDNRGYTVGNDNYLGLVLAK